jgi:hypothetical protein
MPIDYLDFGKYSDIINAKILQILPEIDPTVFGSWQKGFTVGTAALAEALTSVLRDLNLEMFPQTATGEFLDRWGAYEDLPRPPATQSKGNINIGGTLTTNIPIGTIFNNANGFQYQSTATATIVNNTGLIQQLVRAVTLVTCTTPSDHGLTTGPCTIVGFDQAEYNGLQDITVIARNQFTYNVTGSPATPGTGSGSFLSVHAAVNTESLDTGLLTNVSKDGQFAIDSTTPVSGANETGTAQFDGISGGSEEAEDDTYLQLILASRSAIAGVFTPAAISISVLSISGNTRVFITLPTASGGSGAIDPAPGEVSVSFVRDNDPNIIPTPTIIAETKDKIINDGGLPANTPTEFVYVQGPTPVPVPIVFSAISPGTPTMRTAIESSYRAYFVDSVKYETNVSIDSLRGAIAQTVDLETNEQLNSFTITSPPADVVIGSGELATSDAITF